MVYQPTYTAGDILFLIIDLIAKLVLGLFGIETPDDTQLLLAKIIIFVLLPAGLAMFWFLRKRLNNIKI